MSGDGTTRDGTARDPFRLTLALARVPDVDRLLAEARPGRAFTSWHEGDEHQGFTFGSSGIQVQIGADQEGAEAALARFLDDEVAFLLAAARHQASVTVHCWLWPDATASCHVAFSASMLRRLAERGIGLSVTAHPPD